MFELRLLQLRAPSNVTLCGHWLLIAAWLARPAESDDDQALYKSEMQVEAAKTSPAAIVRAPGAHVEEINKEEAAQLAKNHQQKVSAMEKELAEDLSLFLSLPPASFEDMDTHNNQQVCHAEIARSEVLISLGQNCILNFLLRLQGTT